MYVYIYIYIYTYRAVQFFAVRSIGLPGRDGPEKKQTLPAIST